jgi:RNA polymerase sigma-70 factor (ECF subfamily)
MRQEPVEENSLEATGSAKTLADAACAESLETFLKDVQGRALSMARLATGNADEALDLVQDAMTAFVGRYRDKPADERRPLFFRTLNNRITDWHRQRSRRGRWHWPWTQAAADATDGPDLAARSPRSQGPDRQLADGEFASALNAALHALPLRQRQVFLLRAWEGLDTAETADALRIGTGSVKTHYFRALATLRSALEEFDEQA